LLNLRRAGFRQGSLFTKRGAAPGGGLTVYFYVAICVRMASHTGSRK
jgi:hypothetical protein